MSASRTYTIINNYKGREYVHTGTLKELVEQFGYRLECNNVNLSKIRTIKTLMKHLRNATDYWSINSTYELEY